MKSNLPAYAILLTSLVFLAARPIAAQDATAEKEPPKVELTFKAAESRLAVTGAGDFPDGTFLDVATVFEQDGQVAKWSPAYLEAGRIECEIDLSSIKIYPGTYRIDVWFVLDRQAIPIVQEVSKRLGVPIDFRTRVGTGLIEFGTAEEELDLRDRMLVRFEQDMLRLQDLAVGREEDFRSTYGSGSGLLDEAALSAYAERAASAFKVISELRGGLQDLSAEYLYLPFGPWVYRIDKSMLDLENMLDNHKQRLEIRLQLQKAPDPDLEAVQKDLARKALKLEVTAIQESRNLAGFFHSQLEGLRVEREGR